jgi:hypothetical protein
MALYGITGEFGDAAALARALRSVVAAGFRDVDAYMPFPVDEVIEALPPIRDRIPLLTLCGGVLGGTGGYFMQWYSATISYPINVGGRPLNSWPSFIPITFELAVLGAALAAVFGMLALNRLPRLRHPLFGAPHFDCASRSRFFVCVRATDPRFDEARVRALLAQSHALEVAGVEE